jgi:hypothetical protein
MACPPSTFGLVQSFDVDGGALAGHTLAEAFTLGVEWGIAWEKAKAAGPSKFSIHAENADRIGAMLADQARRFSVGPASSGFVEVSIAGLD